MSLSTVLARGRTAALARMDSEVIARRKTGSSTIVNGVKVPEWEVVHAALPYRHVPKGSRPVTIGGAEFSEATARGDVPHDTTDVRDDDHYEITSGEWAGTVVKVIEAVKGDQRTARQLPVKEVPRPSEWG
jgi:hypothetical protein